VYVSQIFVTVGDRVAIGDPLIEVETDKVTLTMGSEVSGVITEVNVVKDGEYEVGDIVCLIDDN
jgi:pyruvate/2-oxoglutarate dehydrogenase complex dihydrolipoamide acyltransferase (E2) component